MGKEAGAAESSTVVLAVNGKRYEAAGVAPSTSLLEFLRTQTPVRGPKLGCGEGGCGACVVLVSKYDPATDEVTEFSASSCLTLLHSVDRCSVTTSEGIGNTRDGYHPVQQRLSGFHASQCGFCTPGMCMSIFSALVKADNKSDRPDPPAGFSKITTSEAEKAVSGNLCRCTGYRPIVDTCKSFASDVDLEDLGLNCFWKKGEEPAEVSRLPGYNSGAVCTFPEFLKSEIKSTMKQVNDVPIAASGDGWYHPKSIEELHRLFDSSWFDDSSVKIVASNTGSGVYKDQDLYDKYIDIKGIPELSVINKNDKAIELGSVVSISKAIEVLSDGNLVFRKIADHLNKVASPFVRNTATIGGNIMMAQRLPFESDVATVLLAAGSTVTVQVASKRLCFTLEEFLEQPPCDSRTLLLSIFIPEWGSDYVTFETFRAAPRPFGNAVSYVNSAFLARTSGSLLIEDICLAFGAYGVDHAIRAKKVEDFLKGKSLSSFVILEAIKLLKDTVSPSEGTTHHEYRVSLAVSFLFSFLSSLANSSSAPSNIDTPNGSYTHETGSNVDSPERHIKVDSNDLPIRSRQEMVFSDEYKPVGKPIKKVGAEIQASGEAVYVDDIPAPKDCLYGAFIYSTHPHAHVRSINFKSSLASQKVITVITAKDIPSGGENIGSSFLMQGEALFADPIAEFAGQNIGVVIAETQRYANMAAKQAVVEYSTENLQPPILTIEDAIQRNSYIQIPPFLAPKPVGDYNKGMAEADHKILSAEVKLESQYYFYMETQAALAIPDEDNCITIYSSTQMPELTQNLIARCLGIPFHNVRVISRRVGGGFGGKAMKATHTACACALAAFKLRRPVRMYLDRKTDMIMAGGRHPMKAKYSVGFKSDGKITALHLDLGINAGISPDVSPLMPRAIIGALKKYNWGTLEFDTKVCKTNVSSKSAMRAPGDVQGSFIAEAIIEHVASALALDTNTVRRKNLHDFESLEVFYGESAGEASTYSLVSMFDKLALSPEYQHRAAMIEQFNSSNKWKKRGISCVPATYEVNLRPTPGKVSIMNDGSIAVEVGGIEIGQGLWTKVKQMTAFGLGQLCPDGGECLLDKVRVIQADTLSLIQGGMTAGSTTSETSCETVRQSCVALVEKLNPIKESLEAKSNTVEWSALIAQASMASVNLSAQPYWTPDPSFKSYLNYGAGTSEVEVDILTGATTILRSDLVYDCGQSLNPAVDLGQIEGCFVQGIGFFTNEDYKTNSDGLVIHDGTWTYKIPTVDNIPKEFNVEMFNSAPDKKRVLSSKASGEPPLVLATSVHCAMREAIRAARKEFSVSTSPAKSAVTFQMDVPATMPVVKELCGLDVVERYLENVSAASAGPNTAKA
ncbi:indole-3-acetaldehyde oxidase [Zea mays]|uniref:Indole-3-acetaldehyde oxidase n=1 Tax=Zea mays TaxID=4577 RepID=ALDO1_MAIZE|nr:indole-3-acetaldehyde oxidase [Zea mays]O23887.1 RecName: Full=Indole-3-acetaldehyde oxidase; Short=IAA oxidase; AltName: Full=Aldehyde oxidase; Short=ZmAO-1 [Zea mays]BAA23226.1 aldehyde oxidase [Zea mays]|eukprot:NP_001105308.1 indole-3-acetaldehyde oxidase [Zea mays]